jgi:hypothetical protein
MDKAQRVKFAARQPCSGQRCAKSIQDVSSAAANFKCSRTIGGEALDKPADQAIACTEPEMIIVDGTKGVVAGKRKSFIDIVEVRS